MTERHPRHTTLLLGQETAEQTFLQAWQSGRLAHAWLLSGPKGVGKATLAFRIARFVLAQGALPSSGGLFDDAPTDLNLSPRHPIFARVASGGHSDLRTFARGFDEKRNRMRNEIVIDDIRELSEFLSLTPAEGAWRVAIIDGAEEMNRNAENALLKSLEEPPKNTLILLVSSAPGRLLPTIHSRCRSLRLSPLDDAVVTELLSSHCPELADADRQALVRLGEGSIGRCLDLAEQGGLDLYRRLLEILDRLPHLDNVALHGFAEQFVRAEADTAWRTLSDLLCWWLARLVRIGARQRPEPEIVPREAALIDRLLRSNSLEQWVAVWEKTQQIFARTDQINLDRKQVLLTVFLAMEQASGSHGP